MKHPNTTDAPRTIGRPPYPTPPSTPPQMPPGIRAHLMDLHMYLDEATGVQESSRSNLFGPRPEATNGCAGKSDYTPSIEELLVSAVSKAAALVGETRTINERL